MQLVPEITLRHETLMLKYLSISALVVITDQITKQLAENMLELYQPIAILPSLNFTLAYNKGAAFSLFADADGWQTIFFTVVALIAAVIIIRMLKALNPDQFQQGLGLAMILGGAVGNLIDRVLYAKVIDFIDVYYSNWHFATFNIADIAISVGAFLVILDACGWFLPGMPRPSASEASNSKMES